MKGIPVPFYLPEIEWFLETFSAAKTAQDPGILSPIVLDLDRDGVETTNVKDGTYFDHDGNGFAEQK